MYSKCSQPTIKQVLSGTFITSLFLMLCALVACKQPAHNAEQAAIAQATDSLSAMPQPTANALAFLNTYDKKYPHDISLLDNDTLIPRLSKLIGPEYSYLKNIWQVETPIEVNKGMFYAWGMQAHSGGDPSAVLMADINKNVLYVGIRKNGEEKIYTEDSSKAPQRLLDWANEQ